MSQKTVYNIGDASPCTAFENPVRVGHYLLPANTTEVTPPTFDASSQTCSFDGNQWLVTEIPEPEPEPEPEHLPAIVQLRMERNQLLRDTDWRLLPDYPGSNQTEWRTYRQSLRDITTQTPSLDENGNLTGITWPTPPTD